MSDALRSLGSFEPLDSELARALSRLAGGESATVELAIALTSRNVRRGHSCFPLGTSAREIQLELDGPLPDLPSADSWASEIADSRLTRGGPLVLDDAGRLYLRRYWQLEQDIAAQLAMRASRQDGPGVESNAVEAALERLFPATEDALQRQAARNALEHSVSLLCGGPGTGKTTTVATILALLVERHRARAGSPPRVMLLAPTGKSAARLGEAVRRAKQRIAADERTLEQIPESATTVHRALGMRRSGASFRRNAEHPLEADVIVLDEASMVDLGLMRQLLVAAPPGATMVVVGDPNQLTSVEAGSVLRDLVTADRQTWWTNRVTELEMTYRYDRDQPLGRLVTAIRSGDQDSVRSLLTEDGAEGVAWTPESGLGAELDAAATRWATTVSTTDPRTHFDLRRRHVLLSPFRRGAIGTERLGLAIEERLRTSSGHAPAVTPIIIEENSQELGIFNGDFAMLLASDPPVAVVQSDGDAFAEVVEAKLPRYSAAYALSVHKAQGSEFDEVLIALPNEDAPLLSRELLYTAVSRARQRARLVGSMEVIEAAIARRARRYSGLVDGIANAR